MVLTGTDVLILAEFLERCDCGGLYHDARATRPTRSWFFEMARATEKEGEEDEAGFEGVCSGGEEEEEGGNGLKKSEVVSRSYGAGILLLAQLASAVDPLLMHGSQLQGSMYSESAHIFWLAARLNNAVTASLLPPRDASASGSRAQPNIRVRVRRQLGPSLTRLP